MIDNDFHGFSYSDTGDFLAGLTRTHGTAGSQYLHIPVPQAVMYSPSFHTSARNPILQNEISMPHLFDPDLSSQWPSEEHTLRRWMPQISSTSIGIPQMREINDDSNFTEELEPIGLHRASSQLSYQSSSPSNSPESSCTLSDTASYSSSSQFLENQTFSELQVPDSGDTASRHANFRGTNGHTTLGPSGSSILFTSRAEDVLFASPVDIGSQISMTSSILTSNGLSFENQMTSLSWDVANSDSSSSSPTVHGSPPINNFDHVLSRYASQPFVLALPNT